MKSNKTKIKYIAININGDLSFNYILKNLDILNSFNYIFVGENLKYKHPFILVSFLLENTDVNVSTGIVSPYIDGCNNILRFCYTISKYYPNRFTISIGMGDVRSLKKLGIKRPKLSFLKRCIKQLKSFGIKTLSGASGKRSITILSECSDGILLNYSHPEYIKWALKHVRKKDILKACYAPSLILPDEKNYMDLILSAAYILTGYPKSFLEDFDLIEIKSVIEKALNKKDLTEIKRYEKFLIENFTISGDVNEILDKLKLYKKIGIDLVIFATPIYKNFHNLKILAESISQY